MAARIKVAQDSVAAEIAGGERVAGNSASSSNAKAWQQEEAKARQRAELGRHLYDARAAIRGALNVEGQDQKKLRRILSALENA